MRQAVTQPDETRPPEAQPCFDQPPSISPTAASVSQRADLGHVVAPGAGPRRAEPTLRGALSAQREAVASRSEMLVGAVKEVSGKRLVTNASASSGRPTGGGSARRLFWVSSTARPRPKSLQVARKARGCGSLRARNFCRWRSAAGRLDAETRAAFGALPVDEVGDADARGEPAEVSRASGRWRRGDDAVRQHRPRAGHPGEPEHAFAEGCRAHRGADAGESVLRSLLRRDAWRARVRRSASGGAAERQAGVVPGRGHHRGAAISPLGPERGGQPGAHFHRGSRPQLGPDASDVQRRQLGPVAADQDHHVHGAHGALGPSVSLRAGRCVHRVRRLPLLGVRADRSQPVLHLDRLGRERREGRRAGHRQRRDRVQLDDLSGAAAGGGDQLEDLSGHRPRPRQGSRVGLDTG